MREQGVSGRTGEQGFTLIEAMVAMVILLFGIAAVSNLMVIAGSSNTVANHSTAATAAATRQMEMLKSMPFATLVPGGSLAADVGAIGICGVTPVNATFNCDTPKTAGNIEFAGVAQIHIRWSVTTVAAVPNTVFIAVQAESRAPAIGPRSRASFTTFRNLAS